MRAYCITLIGNQYSERASARCIESAAKVGQDVQVWRGVSPDAATTMMHMSGLEWTWANENKAPSVCPITGLNQHPYRTADQRMRVGCSMSHYQLWEKCVQLGEPILILEHDAVFARGLPAIDYVRGAIMINNPARATPRGDLWARSIIAKGRGIHTKTIMHPDVARIPDGLAGGSAYIIAPHAAAAAIGAFKHLGVWPNDATLCRQIVGGLHEVFPFVTTVEASKSMAGGY